MGSHSIGPSLTLSCILQRLLFLPAICLLLLNWSVNQFHELTQVGITVLVNLEVCLERGLTHILHANTIKALIIRSALRVDVNSLCLGCCSILSGEHVVVILTLVTPAYIVSVIKWVVILARSHVRWSILPASVVVTTQILESQVILAPSVIVVLSWEECSILSHVKGEAFPISPQPRRVYLVPVSLDPFKHILKLTYFISLLSI